MFLRGLWDVSLNGDLIEISQTHLMPVRNEISTWFPLLHRTERACELQLLLYYCSTKYIVLGCKPRWSAKKKKKTSCEKWLLGGVLQKPLTENFTKFTEKYLVESPLSEEAIIQRCSVKRKFLKISQKSGTGVSCEFCEISQNTLSYRTSPVVASASNTVKCV